MPTPPGQSRGSGACENPCLLAEAQRAHGREAPARGGGGGRAGCGGRKAQGASVTPGVRARAVVGAGVCEGQGQSCCGGGPGSGEREWGTAEPRVSFLSMCAATLSQERKRSRWGQAPPAAVVAAAAVVDVAAAEKAAKLAALQRTIQERMAKAMGAAAAAPAPAPTALPTYGQPAAAPQRALVMDSHGRLVDSSGKVVSGAVNTRVSELKVTPAGACAPSRHLTTVVRARTQAVAANRHLGGRLHPALCRPARRPYAVVYAVRARRDSAVCCSRALRRCAELWQCTERRTGRVLVLLAGKQERL